MSPAAEVFVDPGSFVAYGSDASSSDPLAWPGYPELLSRTRETSGSDESVTSGSATIGGHPVELALFDFSFLGGSMGEVTGERLALAMERAARSKVPFVLRTSTGGARMQEGMKSLVQMPKTIVARRALAQAEQPFIAVLAHPTTGGVLASLAALADITIAESDATVGFAGPRVVEQVTGETPGNRSHSAVTAYAHGLVDDVVPTGDVRAFLAHALTVLADDFPELVDEPEEISDTEVKEAWDVVLAARAGDRPSGEQIARGLSDDVIWLRGDRSGADDPALAAALLRVRGRRSLVVALNRDSPPAPSAYRKARRCLQVATNLGLPVTTLIDTRGADPSSGSENAGIAWEIARTMEAMLAHPTPTVSVVIGEGGSGGALALATADVLLAFQDSVFSVIGPEAAAAILWRDGGRAPEAAELLRLTAADLFELGIADAVLAEPLDPDRLANVLAYHLDRLASTDTRDLIKRRTERWRHDGNR